MILVLGGIAVAMHHCNRECQVTKRQEILAAQNQQMTQQAVVTGSAGQYQVHGQLPMVSQEHTAMMTSPPEIAHTQVVAGVVLPGQPFAQQPPLPPPVAQGP